MPEQQVLDAICNLVDGGGIRHVREVVIWHLVGFVQGRILQCQPLVLEVWFTNFSSTGSRREDPYRAILICAAPATVSRRAFCPAFVDTTDSPETGHWEGDKGCSA